MVERHAAHARARFVGHQFEVVGLAADDAAQRHQCVVAAAHGHGLQRDRHFERAGNLHMVDVLRGHAQLLELGQAGGGERIGDVGVEARLHDADAQAFSVERRVVVSALVCTLHGGQSFVR